VSEKKVNFKTLGLLSVILLAAPLVQAAPTGNAVCYSGSCSGEVRFAPGSVFGFGGPSDSELFSEPLSESYPENWLADFGLGTNGGSFSIPPSGFDCEYWGGADCSAEVKLGGFAFPDNYDAPVGTFLITKGATVVMGDYCYPCEGSPFQNQFSLDGVGRFTFEVTAPQTYYLREVDMTFGPAAPEPATWGFLSLGLGTAAVFRRRRKTVA
jgi:hypothetical protein